MSHSNSKTVTSFEAGSDMSADQFKFVGINASGQLALAGDGTTAIGVLENKPAAAGRAGSVAIAGIVQVLCGGTVTRGGQVASDAAGLAVDSTTADIILGEALMTGAAGSVISIMLQVRGPSA